ncbi:MAG: hypothetical protein GY941_11945 [Planctomycetes bacterium]|nr:hypothetical protein [Planctomycetota bacterium]
MDQFIRSNRDALEETTDEGVLRLKNKLSIFSVYQWNLLAVGYKHPDDRTKQVPVKDMRSADKRERMTLIGHKLKEAFAAQA